jgi:probable HAF family extracellular repeat protein
VTQFVSRFKKPRGVAFDGAGNLYLADENRGLLVRFRAPVPPRLSPPAFTNQSPLTVSGTTDLGSRIDAFLDDDVHNSFPVETSDGAYTLDLDLRRNASNSLRVFTTTHLGQGLTSAPAAFMIVHDDRPPVISDLTPVNGSFLDNPQPMIQATFSDLLSGVDPASVSVLLDGADVTARANISPSGFILDPRARLTEGPHTFSVSAADLAGNSASASASFTILLNRPPVAVDDATTTVESTPVTNAVLANDTDPDGDLLSVIGATQGTNGAVAVNADGSVTYTPNPAFLGTDQFTYTISDGKGGAATARVFVTVTVRPPVAGVKITPGAVLLTAAGETRLLSARAFDASGNPLRATVSWTSSRPEIVEVNGGGRITARASVGSAQIVAQADGIDSEPALVAVARPAAGALLVRDGQVVSPPEPVDPEAPFEVGTQFRTTLRDIVTPVPGTILLGTEEIPLGGRVIAAEESNGLVTVTLEAVPIAEVVTDLVINETIDLSKVEPKIPPEVSERFTVTRTPDGTLEFVPKSETVVGRGALPAAAAIAGDALSDPESNTVKFKVPPFECEANVVWPALSITLGALSMSQTLDVDFIYDSSAGGLQRLALKGDVAGKGQVVKVSLAAAVEGAATCKLPLMKLPVPLPPILRFVLKPEVPLGVGFGVAGKVTVANVGIEPTLEASLHMEVGLSCPGGQTCQALHAMTPKVDGALNKKLPSLSSNLTDQFRVEPEISAFVFADFEDDGPLATVVSAVGQVDIGPVLEAKAGLKEAASLATVTGQMADDAYQSDYKLTLDAVVGVGAAVKEMLGFFQLTVGADLKVEQSVVLARSPAANSVTVDRASFAIGDRVGFTVTLDPSTLTFPIPVTAPLPALVYNVKEIKIFQKKVLPGGGFEPVLIASQAASQGLHEFSLQGTAVQDSTENPANPFYAFVVTTFLPLPVIGDLELGPAKPDSGTYEVIDLGTLGSPFTIPRGINASGQVVGLGATAGQQAGHAFLWQNLQMTDLGTLGGRDSFANDINDSGHVVGRATDAGGFHRAFLWQNGVMGELGTFPGGDDFCKASGLASCGEATGINASGQVAGSAMTASGNFHAFRWENGVITDLGTLPGHRGSGATSINNSGQVVGSSGGRAFLWEDGRMTDLGTLPGHQGSGATSINDSGQVVGISGTASGELRAFLWQNGRMTDLGTPPGAVNAIAYDINASGQVVGIAATAEETPPASLGFAVLWSNGVIRNLNDLIEPASGVVLTSARSINDAGQIVAEGLQNGEIGSRLTIRAFLLTPKKGS